jgi:hypothetical protein
MVEAERERDTEGSPLPGVKRLIPPTRPGLWDATAVVEFIGDDPERGIHAGDQFEAHPYVLDPLHSWVIGKRIGAGSQPGGIVSRKAIKILRRIERLSGWGRK